MDDNENKQNNEVEEEAKSSCEDELRDCSKKRDEYLAGWQRAKADFSNYQKDEQKRIEAILFFQKAELIFGTLEILDNIERANVYLPKDLSSNEWAKGVMLIAGQFQNFLKEHGVEPIKTDGEKFDPHFHEAIEQVVVEGQESGDIIEVVAKGYILDKQVIRPAKVKIAQ